MVRQLVCDVVCCIQGPWFPLELTSYAFERSRSKHPICAFVLILVCMRFHPNLFSSDCKWWNNCFQPRSLPPPLPLGECSPAQTVHERAAQLREAPTKRTRRRKSPPRVLSRDPVAQDTSSPLRTEAYTGPSELSWKNESWRNYKWQSEF